MGVFTESVKKVSRGAIDSFKTFPAAMGSALAFALLTAFRINLDWPEQEAYNFLLNSLGWSFVFGAVFGLAAVTFVKSRKKEKSKFAVANIATAFVVAVSFILLYFFGGYKYFPEDKYMVISGIAMSRVGVAIFVSVIAFVVFGALRKESTGFSRSLFMAQKSFFVAAIYGGVMMAGLSSVAGAFEALLYSAMSYKVYQYIGAAVGFIAFAIFAGNFPDFSKDEVDEKRIAAEKQPKFVETLFSYIMVPIVLALTLVFLIWTIKTVATGLGQSFIMLSGIATGYAVAGIWLHIMVTEHESGMAKFYRKVYPFTALVILAFELWALVEQLNKSGMKSEEYMFMLIWIVAVISILLLVFKKSRAHSKIALIVAIAAIVTVMPIIGYHQLPASMQSSRLESLLESEGMLEGGAIVPADSEPDREVKEGITDAVVYLAYQRDAKLPDWFDRELESDVEFKKAFGFEKTWPEYEGENPEYMGVNLSLKPSSLDVSGYDWALTMQDTKGRGEATVDISGERGKYEIVWEMGYRGDGIPEISVYLDENLILKENMTKYVDGIKEKYLPEKGGFTEAGLEDMSLELSTDELDIMLVFSNIDIYIDQSNSTPGYNLNLQAVYVDEK